MVDGSTGGMWPTIDRGGGGGLVNIFGSTYLSTQACYHGVDHLVIATTRTYSQKTTTTARKIVR